MSLRFYYIVTLILQMILFTGRAFASRDTIPNWYYCRTEMSHNISIPLSASILVNGSKINQGDYIGAFYDSSGSIACGGYVRWNGTSSVSITLWGDELKTTQKEGFLVNETIKWKIWRNKDNKSYTANPAFHKGTGRFQENALDTLSSLISKDVSSGINPGWTVNPTNLHHTIAIPKTADLSLGNAKAGKGDYIGVFYDSSGTLACAGYAIWDGESSVSITAWGNDEQTQAKDGFNYNEVFKYKIWKCDTRREYTAHARYDYSQPDDSIFNPNGLSILNSLDAVRTDIENRIVINTIFRFDETNSTSSYKMIGLPGDTLITLKSIIMGKPLQDWVAFYDNGQENYLTYDGNNTGEFTFRPGKAFWILSRNSISIDSLEVPSAIPDDLTNSYSIPLIDGWNMISNPYNLPVKWESVRQLNSISDEIHYFKYGSFTQSSYYFEMYKGYYFYNRNGLKELKIPYPSSVTLQKSDSKNTNENSMNLAVIVSGEEKSVITIIDDSSSEDGLDTGDQFAPPAGMEEYKIYIENPDADSKYKYFSADSRPGVAEGKIFNLCIKSHSGENTEVKLYGNLLDRIPGLFLVRKSNSEIKDISGSDRFVSFQENNIDQYRLIICEKSKLESILTTLKPESFTLFQNYPNPFNPSTTIKYGLPEAGKITLTLYDVMGRRLATLIEEEKSAGDYAYDLNAGKFNLASGIYFCRMNAKNFTKTIRMILLK